MDIHLRTGPAATICGLWNGLPNARYVTGNVFTEETSHVTCPDCLATMASDVEKVLGPCSHPSHPAEHCKEDGNGFTVCTLCGRSWV